jgi:superfamily II DNA or RNA helicase
MRAQCKHVAAALFECLKREKQKAPRDAKTSKARPRGGAPSPLFEENQPRLALTPQLSSWLDRFTSALVPASAPSAPRGNQRAIRYVLNHAGAGPGCCGGAVPAEIRVLSVRFRKDGSITDIKSFDLQGALRTGDQRPRFVTDADALIVRDLLWVRQGGSSAADIKLPSGAAGLRLLDALLASGRLHYGGPEGPVLRAGPPQQGGLQWVRAERNAQRLSFVPRDGSASRFDLVLQLDPPHYADIERGVLGPIETGLPPKFAAEAALAPEISASEAILVKALLTQRLASLPVPEMRTGAPALPLPEATGNAETRIMEPVPRLDLAMLEVGLKGHYAWYAEDAYRKRFPIPVARLSFDYDGEIVAAANPGSHAERIDDGTLILMPRNREAERKALERAGALGMRALNKLPFDCAPENAGDLFPCPEGGHDTYTFLATFDDPSRYIAFSADCLPLLMHEGWQISFAEDYPYRIAEGHAEWWADIGDGSGIGWFSFEMGIEFEGHRINLVAQLTDILSQLPAEVLALALQPDAQDEFSRVCGSLRLYHRLPGGRLLPLPGDRLAPILKGLLELIGVRSEPAPDGKLRLHRAEAASLAAFAETLGESVAWAGSASRLIELGEKLRPGRPPDPVVPPSSFKASLRPYQQDGLAWLSFLRGAGFGGVLADDMGLGKTVQALAFLAHEKAEGRLDKPALILCPTSVLPNWQAEARRFAPELSVLALRGTERKQRFAEIGKQDLVLTTYPLLARDHDFLLAEKYHAAILDEAQAIKNPKTAIAMLAHRIDAPHRFALTGTPLENNLGEVWSLFEFLSPGLLGDEKTFRRVFRTPIEKHNNREAQAFLSRRLKPFMLRRTKESVAPELPPKTETTEYVQLEGAQRDLYETVRVLMEAKVRGEIAKKGLARSHIVFLEALLKLRQVCCDPRLLKMPQAKKVKSSAKLIRLMEMMTELVAEGRRILLFSQFTSMLALIEDELKAQEIPYAILTGSTEDRAAPVDAFQSGKVPVFLLSLKAGGTGLNLTAADTVIHYDPWWNPAVESQATDRAYRIGQDKPVFVYKLIVEEGVEIAIEQLKTRKAALAEALFDGAVQAPLDLTEADIATLFAPLNGPPIRRAA